MKKMSDFWIILCFALLHAGVALGCRAIGLTDDLMLTLLTMMMTILICLRRQKGVPFMALSVLLVNIVGLVLGKVTASLLLHAFSSPLVVYPSATFICTEVIGWLIVLLSTIPQKKDYRENTKGKRNSLTWLLIAFVLIIVIRLAILLMGNRENVGTEAISILLDYIFTLAVLVFLIQYSLRQQAKAKEASEQAHLAQYRYLMLKQQVNPHFLFNSLNILDFMIQEQSCEEAAEYTQKLSDIYRYLIRSEDIVLVKLRDELEFVQKYVDLLQVRWPQGFEVKINVPEELLNRQVVPCGLQLLIENATKHNAVMPDNPLKVDITASTDKDTITVTNNLVPKMSSKSDSTGLGLKYIRRHYEDMAKREIVIEQTSETYSVTLPLV